MKLWKRFGVMWLRVILGPPRDRVLLSLWLVGILLAGLPTFVSCAHYPINEPLESFEVTDETMKPRVSEKARNDELVLMLAFSGGGTRAAALSYGVLEALAKVQIPARAGGPVCQSLLDDVDIISSVSGGSFTGAHFALYGEEGFKDFEERFLYYNVNRGLLWRMLLPTNWIRLSSPYFGRSDLAAEYYDKLLFHGATYEDLWAREGPVLAIQATDISDGIRFSFTRYSFALLCSDLASFPIARAVAASAAFPGPFDSVRLYNYAGTCGLEKEDWLTEALEERDVSSRTFHKATQVNSYFDTKRKARIHLLDGGISDNIGIRGTIEMIAARGGIRKNLEDIGLDKARRIAFIIVNAEGETGNPWGLTDVGPRLAGMLGATSSIMISSYNFETVELLRQSVKQWSTEKRNLEGAEQPIEFYVIEIGFSALPDDEERLYYGSIPTSFNLSAQTVDDLREVAGRILYESKPFQKLVHDLGGKIPSSVGEESGKLEKLKQP